jgi:hypothetical protein
MTRHIAQISNLSVLGISLRRLKCSISASTDDGYSTVVVRIMSSVREYAFN